MPVLVDVRTPRTTAPADLIAGFGGAVLEVSDADRAARFYREVLGLIDQGDEAEGPRLRLGSAQLTLCQRPQPKVLPDSGTHLALRLPAPDIGPVLRRLEASGVDVHDYREDRPAEQEQNRYFADPDGNRLQLVVGDSPGIDHAAVETHDLEWAETFYTHVLGGAVETRVGWRMADYAGAKAWGEGKDGRAPGTRRWDKLYSATINPEGRVARPNAHIFVTLGPGVVIGLYLAAEHRQEPPLDQFAGTPRICLQTSHLDELEQRLREVRLRCLPTSKSGGPFERHGRALFVRDPGGNFLELRGE
ncbi:MAG TPA: VOC family protein [Chloroflexota bacterium]